MKKIYFTGLLFIFGIVAISCKNEPAVNATTVELTVKNENGAVVPYIPVYLFNTSSAVEAGKTPARAITSGITNSQGLVKISLEKVGNLDKEPTLYFTVLERPLSLEYKVLGTLELKVSKNQPSIISDELQISNRKLQYPYGIIPTAFDSELAKDEYDRWKTTQIVNCSGGLRVIANPSNLTLVEAMGFGTLLSAYAGDRTTFDGLMTFYNSKRTTEAKNMMGWKVTCDGIVERASATDGDVDVAFANIIAYKQWGGSYLDKAKEIIGLIRNNLILDCTVNGSNVKILAPGCSNGQPYGGCGETDIMYHTPAYFRVFARVTGDQTWNQLADDTYKLLNASANPTTGLVPDWQTASGTPGPAGRVGYFGYDACRAPWKLALDYLWNGNTEAKNWCVKISNWAYGVGAENIVDGYELNGTPRGNNGLNSAFLGGFTVSMMANDYTKVNNFATVLARLNDTYWFNLNTRVLYLFALTGNFWEPDI
ncbi:MAG: hypothetical protein LLF95_10115 [Bacteroidales bacterium]|nr:hypothetical protein [Bacteroidales bacterium]